METVVYNVSHFLTVWARWSRVSKKAEIKAKCTGIIFSFVIGFEKEKPGGDRGGEKTGLVQQN